MSSAPAPKKMSASRLQLHVAVDPTAISDLSAFARAVALGGADVLHLRAKAAPARSLLEAGRCIQAAWQMLSWPTPVPRLLVNDRVDVALLLAADGVQLPQAGLPPHAVRRLWQAAIGRSPLIGLSIHAPPTPGDAAVRGTDFLLFGHVFASASKPGQPPRGLDELGKAAAAADVPVIAIGGIGADNVADVCRHGAAGVAVISAVVGHPDPQAAVAALRQALDAAFPR